MAREPLDAEYDDVEEEQEGSENDLLQRLLVMAPSWLGSAIVHAVLLLVFAMIQWNAPERLDATVNADIKPPEVEDIEEVEEPQRPEASEEPDIVDNSLPPADVAFIPEVEMDQPDIDVPGFNELDPDEDPPLAIAKLALGTEGAAGHFHGIYSSRGGRGRQKSMLRFGGSRLAEKAVDDALGWLARVQEPDGHWDAKKWGANRQADAGVTGLALLAFLGHGETDRDGKYRNTVCKALEWLEKTQQENGYFGERFYTQGICTMATCEAYGMTRNPRWKTIAQRAINYTCANQNPMGGWDYMGINANRVDTSVSGWCVMGIKSGLASELDVPSGAIERIKRWLASSVNADGTTGYSYPPGRKADGMNSMTAVATMCRQFMGWDPSHPDMTKALAKLKGKVDLGNMYYTYYGTLAMFQAGGELWDEWNRGFRDPLIDKQVKGRGPEFDGSWDTEISYGSHGGRVYSTAMSVFCLEVYYRFLPVLKAL